jgi:hypothetical protein
MGMAGQSHAPGHFTPGTYCTGGCVGSMDGLDGSGKSGTPTGILSLDRLARSKSLYRLSHPGPQKSLVPIEQEK